MCFYTENIYGVLYVPLLNWPEAKIFLGCWEKNGSLILLWSSVGAHITGYAMFPKGQAMRIVKSES